MTLLGNINLYEEEEEELFSDNKYTYNIYKKDDENDISLKKCFCFSVVLHPIAVGMVWLGIFLLALLGVHFSIFDKPQQKPKDIEFVLVNKEAEPINKNTKFRADRNSRAGGIHDPKRPVSQPQAASQASKPQQAAPAHKAKPQKAQQPERTAPKPKAQVKQPPKPAVQMPWSPKKAAPAPTPKASTTKAPTAAPRPAIKPSTPKTSKPGGNFNIPMPKVAAPKVTGPAGGPIAGSKTGTGSKTSSSATGSRTPAPSFSPSGGSSSGGRFSPGSAGRGGNIGNPSPGNPKGAPGIDAIKEPDFGPYMRELQRRIKMNWEPPKGNESKRVVLLFKIARDGRLISHRVYKSSGLPAADRAAMHAVELTAPFKPLPPEYKGDSVDIQFTFDYNVFGATTY